MPKIPSYTATATLPESAGQAYGKDTPEMPSMGAGFYAIGDAAGAFADAIGKAQQASGVSKATSDASVSLNDLRNRYLASPDFNLNPGSALDAFKQDVTRIRQRAGEGLSDPKARLLFDDHFNKLAAAHMVTFQNDVRKSQINLAQASILSAVDRFTQAAASAPDEAVFHENIKGIHTALAGAMATGTYPADQVERLREHSIRTALISRANMGLLINPMQVQNAILSRQGIYKDLPEFDKANLLEQADNRIRSTQREEKRIADEMAVNDAYADIFSNYHLGKGGSYDAAIRSLDSPEEMKRRGLDIDQAAKVQQRLHTAQQQILYSQDRAEKARAETFSQQALNKFTSGRLTEDEVLSADIPSDVKQHWIGAIDRQFAQKDKDSKEKLDQRLYDQIMVRINSDPDDPDHIGSVNDILPFVAAGRIPGQKLSEINSAINTANDPMRNPYIRDSRQMFLDEYADTPQMKAFLPRFLGVLNRDIQTLGLKGSQITGHAEKLLKTHEQNWFKSILSSATGGWVNPYTESGDRLWQTEYQQREAEKARVVTTPSAPAVDPAIQAKVESLRKAGTSDAEIIKLFRAGKSTQGLNPKDYGLIE